MQTMNKPESLVMSKGNNFYGRVMLWLAVAFGVSVLGIVFIGPLVPQSMMMPLYIVTLAVLLISAFARKHIRKISGFLALFIPLALGVILYPTLNYFVEAGMGNIIFLAAAGTTIVFGTAAIMGWTSKKSLNKYSGLLFGVLLGIIGVSLLNAFLVHLALLQFLISIAALVVFAVYSYIDVQAIRDQAWADAPASMYALNVFLDITNIFISLLNIFSYVSRS